MSTTVEFKFDIGDEVWVANALDCWIVKGIVSGVHSSMGGAYYLLGNNVIRRGVIPERWMHKTAREAFNFIIESVKERIIDQGTNELITCLE